MLSKKASLGRQGENAAATFLQNKGLLVVDRNWRCGSHELDLVCQDDETLVFVEVRTRSANGMTSPVESITPAKMRHCVAAAQEYMLAHNLWHKPCRFDVISVLKTEGSLTMEHYPDVLSNVMDCSDTAWQPW